MKVREILRALRPLRLAGHDIQLGKDGLFRCRRCRWPVFGATDVIRCTSHFITLRGESRNWRFPVPDCRTRQVQEVHES